MNLNQVDISKLPSDIRKQFKQLQVMYAEKKIQNKAKDDFLSFVKTVWPEFIEGAHHRHIAKKFNDLATGKIPLPKEKPILLVCAVGGRSYFAGQILTKKGYKEVYNLSGGVKKWYQSGLPLTYDKP